MFEGRVKDKKGIELRASTLRGDMRMLRAELNQLKQFQTFQAQQFAEMIRNAREQLVHQVSRLSTGNNSLNLLIIIFIKFEQRRSKPDGGLESLSIFL